MPSKAKQEVRQTARELKEQKKEELAATCQRQIKLTKSSFVFSRITPAEKRR